HAEALGMLAHHHRAELVAIARAGTVGAGTIALEPHAGAGDRGDRGLDAGLVHLLERDARRPILIGRGGKDARVVEQALQILRDVTRRIDVMMRIDDARHSSSRISSSVIADSPRRALPTAVG